MSHVVVRSTYNLHHSERPEVIQKVFRDGIPASHHEIAPPTIMTAPKMANEIPVEWRAFSRNDLRPVSRTR